MNTSIAIWCENSSSVAGPLGDLADMFRYVEDNVVDVECYFSSSTKKRQWTTRTSRSGHRRHQHHSSSYVIPAWKQALFPKLIS